MYTLPKVDRQTIGKNGHNNRAYAWTTRVDGYANMIYGQKSLIEGYTNSIYGEMTMTDRQINQDRMDK